MDRPCDRFEQYRSKRDRGFTGSEQRDFEEHLAHCPACADQAIADDAITNLFSEFPLPGLSPSFNDKLRFHLMEERKKPSRGPLLMTAYWLVACVFSAVVLITMEINITESMNALVFLFLCFAVPVLVLGRMLRFNLFDLILASMNRSETGVSILPSDGSRG